MTIYDELFSEVNNDGFRAIYAATYGAAFTEFTIRLFDSGKPASEEQFDSIHEAASGAAGEAVKALRRHAERLDQ